MFNFSGSELVFLLLLALIILGPEKLPEAIRKFGQTYAEFKKVTTGFQSELKQALDEPVREMRETAELFKQAATFEVLKDDRTTAAVQETTSAATAAEVDTGSAPPLASAAAATAAVASSTPSTGTTSDAEPATPAGPVDNIIVRQPFGQAAALPSSSPSNSGQPAAADPATAESTVAAPATATEPAAAAAPADESASTPDDGETTPA